MRQRDSQDSMGQLLPVFNGLLGEHSGKVLLHEGVEVGVALPRLKVLPLQQGKRDDHFQQPLLVVYAILDAVECGDAFKQASG